MAAKAHVRYAIFNACHHGHNAQSHALRTRGPCIPIGNFPGLIYQECIRTSSPPYKSEKLAKSCTSVATSAEQAELFRVVREGHPIPESTCWTSPIVIQPVEKRPFWSNGKKHVFLWKLAPAQEKDWAKGYPKVSPILPFLLPVMLHLWQHAFLAFGEEFPGWNLKSS